MQKKKKDSAKMLPLVLIGFAILAIAIYLTINPKLFHDAITQTDQEKQNNEVIAENPKTLKASIFPIEFSYPNNWQVIEVKNFPIAEGVISDVMSLKSLDGSIQFSLKINPEGYDGGDSDERLEINGREILFKVTRENDGIYYYSNFSPDQLGLSIQGASRIQVDLRASSDVNTSETKAYLVDILSSLRVVD